jgi:threonine aldolase
LAERLNQLDRFDIDLERVQTNMVYFDSRPPISADALEEACREQGLLIDRVGPSRVRLVTHWGVDAGDVDRAVEILSNVTDRLTTDL